MKRLMITKLDRDYCWSITSNPEWDMFSEALNAILGNFANDYAEYKNCGVIHRMIRIENIDEYGFAEGSIRPEWILETDDLG